MRYDITMAADKHLSSKPVPSNTGVDGFFDEAIACFTDMGLKEEKPVDYSIFIPPAWIEMGMSKEAATRAISCG